MTVPDFNAVDAIVRHLFQGKTLPNGEVIELMKFDGNCTLRSRPEEPPAYIVRAMRHHPDEYGANKRWRWAEVRIPSHGWMEHAGEGQILEYVDRYLRRLMASIDDPPKPPKGWKKFGRAPRT